MRQPETTLYFVRHGQSVANAGGVTMEHAIIPLSPLGMVQAARVAEFTAELPDLPGESVIFGHGIWFGMLCWKLRELGADDSHDMKAFRRFQAAMRMPNCAVYTLTGSPTGRWLWGISEEAAAAVRAS